MTQRLIKIPRGVTSLILWYGGGAGNLDTLLVNTYTRQRKKRPIHIPGFKKADPLIYRFLAQFICSDHENKKLCMIFRYILRIIVKLAHLKTLRRSNWKETGNYNTKKLYDNWKLWKWDPCINQRVKNPTYTYILQPRKMDLYQPHVRISHYIGGYTPG